MREKARERIVRDPSTREITNITNIPRSQRDRTWDQLTLNNKKRLIYFHFRGIEAERIKYSKNVSTRIWKCGE